MRWGMMMSNVSAVANYNFNSEDELFLDTNVWIFVYGPQKPGNPKVETYSQAFAKILMAQCRIYIDVLIVSEFINTCARLEWDIMDKPYGDFKKFRNSTNFKPIAQDIAAAVKRVLSHCSRVENGFEMVDIDGLIAEYGDGKSDFNDQIIAALCRRRGLTLVTDDGDFAGQELPIVTANKRLLR